MLFVGLLCGLKPVFEAALGFLESEALAVGLEDVDAVGEAVEGMVPDEVPKGKARTCRSPARGALAPATVRGL